MTNQAPIDKLYDGNIQASIFGNSSENGTFYSVQLSRTYTDDQGKYHNASSFSGTELLKVARLAHLAYDRIAELRAAARQAGQADEAEQSEAA